MKLHLEIVFHSDGDFHIEDGNTLIDTNSSFYNGAKLDYIYTDDYEMQIFILNAEGEPNPCRWAARDMMENMVCNLRTHKHYVIPMIYEFIITNAKEPFLWSAGNVKLYNCLSGNYDNSRISLRIIHE